MASLLAASLERHPLLGLANAYPSGSRCGRWLQVSWKVGIPAGSGGVAPHSLWPNPSWEAAGSRAL